MTLSVIDFLRESSKFLVRDRPDVYHDESVALKDLMGIMDRMRDTPGSGVTSFVDYMMIRYQDDEEGIDEWDLVRKLSSFVSFADEDHVWVYSHTKDSGTLKYGVDLPDVDDDIDI